MTVDDKISIRSEKIETETIHTRKPKHNYFVKEKFKFSEDVKLILQSLNPNFGYDGFGEFIFYRTYSRMKSDGINENWADCVIRVTEGTLSIRKDWYKKAGIGWDDDYWQRYAKDFSYSLFHMHWTPPGRGLWAMGTDYVYDRGSLALYNCAYTKIQKLDEDIRWLMDALMNGVGVGFECIARPIKLSYPNPHKILTVVIGDDREGWCESI